MDRVIMAVMLAVAALCLGLTAKNFIDNPQQDRARALAKRIQEIPPKHIDYVTQSNLDYTTLQNQLVSKPRLFQELIAPPPPPKPPAPPPPKPPDLNELLKGVTATRMEISRGGVKQVQMMTPKSKAPEFFKEGDVINGVTLKQIGKGEVVFTITANGKEYTKAIPRQ